MAKFQINLTAAGVKLLTGALNGTRLEFTALGMGAGEYSGSAMNLTAPLDERHRLPLQGIQVKNGQATLQASLKYADLLDESYPWRELAVYATNLDTGESILYGYGNAGSDYDTIPAKTDQSLTEKKIRVTVAVSDAATVTALIDNTLLWASQADLDKVNDVIPLTHQKQSNIHLFTGLSRTGLVPVQFTAAADYNAGETLTIDSIRYTVALSSGDEPSGTVWKAGTKQLGLCDSESMTLIIISSKDNVPAHNVDPEAHPDIRALLAGMSADMSQLKNALLTDVTGNPWSVYFTSAGIGEVVVTGTWNEAQARIEF